MMKYLYFAVALITFVLILIAYFQNISYSQYYLNFLSGYVNLRLFLIYLIILSALFGVSVTLFIKAILASDKDLDDEFDL